MIKKYIKKKKDIMKQKYIKQKYLHFLSAQPA